MSKEGYIFIPGILWIYVQSYKLILLLFLDWKEMFLLCLIWIRVLLWFVTWVGPLTFDILGHIEMFTFRRFWCCPVHWTSCTGWFFQTLGTLPDYFYRNFKCFTCFFNCLEFDLDIWKLIWLSEVMAILYTYLNLMLRQLTIPLNRW